MNTRKLTNKYEQVAYGNNTPPFSCTVTNVYLTGKGMKGKVKCKDVNSIGGGCWAIKEKN